MNAIIGTPVAARARCSGFHETESSAGSHSGGQRQRVQREPFRFSRGREKSPALLNAERLHLPPFHARQVHANAGVLNQHLPAHNLSERGLEHRVCVFNGSRGQPTLKHSSVDALDVELDDCAERPCPEDWTDIQPRKRLVIRLAFLP